MSAGLTVFDDADALGEAVAEEIADRLVRRGRLVLGCPAGRTPLPAYRAFARRARNRGLDLSQLHLILMDEYVVRTAGGWTWCEMDAHFSCRGFAERELRQPCNAGTPAARALPAQNVHAPDPGDPSAYERLIERLGGVDLFLLASGASDGHVGFNPRGTAASALTRLIPLDEATRRDNMATFPAFTSLDETPTHGISVGPATIVRGSLDALMILTGEGKREAFERIGRAQSYDPDWPATIVHDCRQARIFADGAASGSRAPASSGAAG